MFAKRQVLAGACFCLSLSCSAPGVRALQTAPLATNKAGSASRMHHGYCRPQRLQPCLSRRALGAGATVFCAPHGNLPSQVPSMSIGSGRKRPRTPEKEPVTRRQSARDTAGDDGRESGVYEVAGTGIKLERGQIALALALVLGVGIAVATGVNAGGLELPGLEEISEYVQGVDVGLFFGNRIAQIRALGPLGYVYFGVLYVIAEILAIPAIPLTASSGYLFGLVGGTLVVLISASIAAGISFMLGRTFLRKWVEELLADNAKFQAIDKAIGKEGFKIILLLRMSPIFPFAISNYLYGLTSVEFGPYIVASLLGFLPGTLAYVYTGSIGKSLLSGDAGLPWYGYVLGLSFLGFVFKTISDVATATVQEMNPELQNKEDSEQDWL